MGIVNTSCWLYPVVPLLVYQYLQSYIPVFCLYLTFHVLPLCQIQAADSWTRSSLIRSQTLGRKRRRRRAAALAGMNKVNTITFKKFTLNHIQKIQSTLSFASALLFSNFFSLLFCFCFLSIGYKHFKLINKCL